MAAYAIAHPGLVQGNADNREIYLKMFADEVLLAFERYSVTDGRVREKRIGAGKSHQFPVFGTAKALMHTPGENIITDSGNDYLSQPAHSEKVITIDGFLQSSVLVADLDEALSQFDVRGPYAREMGWSLAREMDVRTLMTIFYGSEVADTLAGTGDGGDGSWASPATRQIDDPDFNTNVASLRATIKSLAQAMDENDVPEWGRHIAIEPAAYHLLADEDDIVSADFNRNTRGDRGTATVLMLHGLQIHKTNRLADLRAKGAYTASGQWMGTDYDTTYTNAVACAWQEERAVAVLKLRDMALMSQWKLEYLATLMVTGYQCGHGVLHEAACFSVRTSA